MTNNDQPSDIQLKRQTTGSYKILYVGIKCFNTKQAQGAVIWVLDIGYWVMEVLGISELLAAGYWLLASGFWHRKNVS